MFEPAIKWSGSKRSQASAIIARFPREINTYYEPFCGGASVFRALLESNVCADNMVLSDINGDLIGLWKEIQNDPDAVSAHYKQLWFELNKDDDIERKKSYFAEIRNRFNSERNPKDFMFIMRTTTNGMPRYNRNGDFNNSFHVTRPGIHPSRLQEVLREWSELLQNVVLINCSYKDINPCNGDFMYLDPPYHNTKGMYYGAIDYDELWAYLRELNCAYAMSFDGRSGDVDNTFSVPEDIYNTHEYIRSGNSSFKRVIGNNKKAIVYESLYTSN